STNLPPIATAGPDLAAQTLVALGFDGSLSSDADGTIASYTWSFGDGGVASGVAVSHSFARAGLFTVTLTVTDDLGLSSSDTVSVTIANRAPVANAGADLAAPAGTSVTF